MQRTRAIPVYWLSSGLCPNRPKGWIPIIISSVSDCSVFVFLRSEVNPGTFLSYHVQKAAANGWKWWENEYGLVVRWEQRSGQHIWQETGNEHWEMLALEVHFVVAGTQEYHFKAQFQIFTLVLATFMSNINARLHWKAVIYVDRLLLAVTGKSICT